MARAPKRPLTDRFLVVVERVGNLLPQPATLFAILALAVIVGSALASWLDLSAVHPATGETIRPFNLLSVEGLHRILTDMVKNFTGFAPLGTVLVALLGIAVAEGSGLITAVLKLLVLSAPRRLLTFALVFAGVCSNVASEIGYVVLVPLGAVIFLGAGRHPVAGLAAAFAGVSGGYSANLLLGTIDPLLAGITQEAAHLVDGAYAVNPACNYYFMAASTFVIAAAGTWVTERIVEPRLGAYEGPEAAAGTSDRVEPAEKRGLAFAGVATALLAGLILWGTVPSNGFLRDAETGSLLQSPFLSGIVALIFLGGAIVGLTYGIGARTIRSEDDVLKAMSKSMSVLGSYLVLVFFAAQFVAYFAWTNLGLILAIDGARALEATGLGGPPLLVGFILVTAIVNLFMGSASAKWAIMAPVFVPMLMLLGHSPELTQVAYRVGDSAANVVSPLMSYFALIVAFLQRYTPKAGIGNLIATMLPYTIVFLVIWTLLLMVWYALELPLGPGSRMFYTP
jgi:aminobenzoyl-glutamate transport protein